MRVLNIMTLKKSERKYLVVTIALFLTILVFLIYSIFTNDLDVKNVNESQNLSDDEISMGVKLTKDGVKYIVSPDKLISGGPPKDGIPSIDNPIFVSVSDADEWIRDDELVLAITYKGEKRVYPLQILVWHEIVNDVIAGDPILITYCPLCGSGIAYERKIDGNPVEFGVSGKLYNSNLVMYDRKTDTYWTQIDGNAIVGQLTGQRLTSISIDTVVWRDWKENNADSMVLSQDTGFMRLYGDDPYGNYYENSFLFFPVENTDNRIPAKTVVFGIEVNGTYKAYRQDDVKEAKIIEDSVGDVDVIISIDDSGVVTITNKKTGEKIVKERDFWFAWYAFHPDTTLYLP